MEAIYLRLLLVPKQKPSSYPECSLLYTAMETHFCYLIALLCLLYEIHRLTESHVQRDWTTRKRGKKKKNAASNRAPHPLWRHFPFPKTVLWGKLTILLVSVPATTFLSRGTSCDQQPQPCWLLYCSVPLFSTVEPFFSADTNGFRALRVGADSRPTRHAPLYHPLLCPVSTSPPTAVHRFLEDAI